MEWPLYHWIIKTCAGNAGGGGVLFNMRQYDSAMGMVSRVFSKIYRQSDATFENIVSMKLLSKTVPEWISRDLKRNL